MSGENKTKESTGSKESKKPDTLKTSTTSSCSSSSSMGLGNPRSVVPVFDRDEDELQDDEGIKRSLRQMGIRPLARSIPKNRNFESWLNRIEFHFEVTKCPVQDKTGSLLLLLDVECFEVAKRLGLKSTTNFDEAKAKLKDYFAITETSEKLRERLDLRRQEAGESIESFARDIKLIGHRAYPKAADPAMLEHILIKQFVNGLSNEVSRERVILKAPKTLTEAAQFARFAESAVRVVRNHSTAASTPSTLSSLGFRGRGSSSGTSGFASRGREQSLHVSAAFEAVAEVAQLDAEHSIRSHARQAVDRSSDKVNNKIHKQLSASTARG